MPAIDPFAGRSSGERAPFDNCLTVAPSDTADLQVIPSGLYVPGMLNMETGDVTRFEIKLVMQNGEPLTITGEGPTILPFRPVRIMRTGTSAAVTNVTLLW